MELDITKILKQAQKTGTLQIQNVCLQQLPIEVYQVNQLKFDERGFYENRDVTKFFVKGCSLAQLSQDIELLDMLEVIDLQDNKLTVLNPFQLQNLVYLQLSNNKLYEFPQIEQLPVIKQLYINNNSLQQQITINSVTLQILELSNNKIGKLDLITPELQELKCDKNLLQSLNIIGLRSLKKVNAGHNKISNLFLKENNQLQELTLNNNQLNLTVDEQVVMSQLQNLQTIDLSYNQNVNISLEFFKASNLLDVELSDNQIYDFSFNNPAHQQEATHVFAKSKISTINLQNNNLQEVPGEFGLLVNLKRLGLIGNPMRKQSKLLQLKDSAEKIKTYLIDKLPTNHYYFTQYNKNQQNTQIQQQIQNSLVKNVNVEDVQQQSLQVQQQQYYSQQTNPYSNKAAYQENVQQLKFDNIPITQLNVNLFSAQQQFENVQLLQLQNIGNLTQEFLDKQIMKNLNQFVQLKQIIFNQLGNIQELYIFNIKQLQKLEITNMRMLQYVHVQNCPLISEIIIRSTKLVELFAQDITNMRFLLLNNNSLDQIPQCVFEMVNLIELNISGNQISNINDEIELLQQLEVLNVCNNQIKILKSSLGRLNQLKQFQFENNMIIKPGQQIQRKGSQAVLDFLRGAAV